MSEDQELSHLENEWKNSFDRFTSPEPTREQTFNLIEKIKEADEIKPVDLRAELEAQSNCSIYISAKVVNLFLSQWNFHGASSWLLTGIVMLVLTITISQNMGNEMTGFIAWIKWITLIIIAVMGYAFRSKNEGNDIIETLSYYPLIQQMFTRFMIVMGLQLAITLPLSFIHARKYKFSLVFNWFFYAYFLLWSCRVCQYHVVWAKDWGIPHAISLV